MFQVWGQILGCWAPVTMDLSPGQLLHATRPAGFWKMGLPWTGPPPPQPCAPSMALPCLALSTRANSGPPCSAEDFPPLCPGTLPGHPCKICFSPETPSAPPPPPSPALQISELLVGFLITLNTHGRSLQSFIYIYVPLSSFNCESFQEIWIKAVYEAIRLRLVSYCAKPGAPPASVTNGDVIL